MKEREYDYLIDILDRSISRMMISKTLPKGMFGILSELYHFEASGGDGMRTGDLCKKLDRAMPSITRSVNSLERDGFVERTAGKSDRRAVYISLTDRGREEYLHARDTFTAIADRMQEMVGEEKLEALWHIISDIEKAFMVIFDDMRNESDA